MTWLLGDRWGVREWLLLLLLSASAVALVELSGGQLPWWGWLLVGVAEGAFIDTAVAVGRQQRTILITTAAPDEELD